MVRDAGTYGVLDMACVDLEWSPTIVPPPFRFLHIRDPVLQPLFSASIMYLQAPTLPLFKPLLKNRSLAPSHRLSPDKQKIHPAVPELLELYSSPLLSPPGLVVSHRLLFLCV